MSTSQLYIPDKINVGFQNRQGTYTGKLAYVIYFDHKGVLRKEKSWQGWRDHKIQPVEYANEPTEGFVLNKGVGGQRESWGWNARNEYIRVYDPRDFEFEISVANLLFILREGDCSRGKGLEGKFVYAWEGNNVVLLPVSSVDYQNSKKYSTLQASGVKAKDLIKGATYITKRQEEMIYLGRFDYFFVVSHDRRYSNKEPNAKKAKGVMKRHIFWKKGQFVDLDGLSSIGALSSDAVAPNYAELVDEWVKSMHGSRCVELKLQKGRVRDTWGSYRNIWFYQDTDGSFIQCGDERDGQVMHTYNRVYLKDGALRSDNYYTMAFKTPAAQATYRRSYYWYDRNQQATSHWVDPTGQRLVAVLESGSKFLVYGDQLIEKNKKKENDDDGEDEE